MDSFLLLLVKAGLSRRNSAVLLRGIAPVIFGIRAAYLVDHIFIDEQIAALISESMNFNDILILQLSGQTFFINTNLIDKRISRLQDSRREQRGKALDEQGTAEDCYHDRKSDEKTNSTEDVIAIAVPQMIPRSLFDIGIVQSVKAVINESLATRLNHTCNADLIHSSMKASLTAVSGFLLEYAAVYVPTRLGVQIESGDVVKFSVFAGCRSTHPGPKAKRWEITLFEYSAPNSLSSEARSKTEELVSRLQSRVNRLDARTRRDLIHWMTFQLKVLTGPNDRMDVWYQESVSPDMTISF